VFNSTRRRTKLNYDEEPKPFFFRRKKTPTTERTHKQQFPEKKNTAPQPMQKQNKRASSSHPVEQVFVLIFGSLCDGERRDICNIETQVEVQNASILGPRVTRRPTALANGSVDTTGRRTAASARQASRHATIAVHRARRHARKAWENLKNGKQRTETCPSWFGPHLLRPVRQLQRRRQPVPAQGA
jgi:hypothetical protein